MEYITKNGVTIEFIRYCSGVGNAAWFQAPWGRIRKHMTNVDKILLFLPTPIKKISFFMRI